MPAPQPVRLRINKAEIRPYNGWLRYFGFRYESEIGGLFLFEPGYNPVRRHRSLDAAVKRCRKWVNA
jgi:hypothetical protein